MRLLLDVHVPSAVVTALRRLNRSADVVHIADWRHGRLLQSPDMEILTTCVEEERVWVTCDLKSVPGLLRVLAIEERPHAGVILIDEPTLSSDLAGRVANNLHRLILETQGQSWTNRVRFLRR